MDGEKEMKDIFKTNWFLMAVSVLSAILIWIYVVYEISPMYELNMKKVPITYISRSEDFENGKLTVTSLNSETVDIKIRGKRSVISKLKKDDINCSVNMADVKKSGIYSLPINVSFNTDGVELMSKNPYKLSMTVDNVVTVEKKIEIETSGKPADGYIAESVEYNPLKIRLTGAESAVKNVDKALITVDLTGAKDTIVGRYKVKLFDKKGNELEDEDISKNITYTELTYKIYKTQKVDINPVLSSDTNMYGKVGIKKIKPASVTAMGDKRIIMKIDGINTEEIDVRHVKDGDVLTVKLEDISDDVRFEGDISEVEITFEVEEK